MNKPSTRVSKPCAVGKPKERKPGIQNIHSKWTSILLIL